MFRKDEFSLDLMRKIEIKVSHIESSSYVCKLIAVIQFDSWNLEFCVNFLQFIKIENSLVLHVSQNTTMYD